MPDVRMLQTTPQEMNKRGRMVGTNAFEPATLAPQACARYQAAPVPDRCKTISVIMPTAPAESALPLTAPFPPTEGGLNTTSLAFGVRDVIEKAFSVWGRLARSLQRCIGLAGVEA